MQSYPRGGWQAQAPCRGSPGRGSGGYGRGDAVRDARGPGFVDRGRESAVAGLRRHRVRERTLPGNPGHTAARLGHSAGSTTRPSLRNVTSAIRRAGRRVGLPTGGCAEVAARSVAFEARVEQGAGAHGETVHRHDRRSGRRRHIPVWPRFHERRLPPITVPTLRRERRQGRNRDTLGRLERLAYPVVGNKTSGRNAPDG